MPWQRRGASSISVSVLGSGFMGIGFDNSEAEDTLRSGVDMATALGSFFLCDRLPVLVRWGVAVATVEAAERTDGVAGVEEVGCGGGA